MNIFKLMSIISLLLTFGLTACFGGSNESEVNPPNIIAQAVNNAPRTISETEFKQLVMDFENHSDEWKYEGKLPSIVTFTADWCGPCRRMAPFLDELAKEYAGKVNIYKVDVDRSRNVAMTFGIQSIPTLLFSRMNGLPALQPGMMNKEQLVQAVEGFLLKED
ncbi:MAG: thioredoxin domain-containing protein [Bacteroidales bacterium]|nr:thioredoxin domain-containing protein [Bacteroidales bacterium]